MAKGRNSDKQKEKDKDAEKDKDGLDRKYLLWILQAINKVKGQKQRPSEDRIIHVLETGYGLSRDIISEQLDRCVEAGKVLKVTFKGKNSYKDPSRMPGWKKPSEKTMDFHNYVQEALESVGEEGCSSQIVEKWIQENYGDSIHPRTDIRSHVKTILKQGVSAGKFLKENRIFRLSSFKKPKPKANPPKATPNPLCGFCLGPAESNKEGDYEELISCADCGNSGHPSCLKYSPALTARVQSEPWQCIECKTCSVCRDAGDADNLLFCDMCDRGFHMECLDPPMSEMPTGSWVCFLCKTKTPGRKKKGHVDSPIVTPPRRKIQPQSPEPQTPPSSQGMCPTPGCDSTGHVTGRFSTHRSIGACPIAAESRKAEKLQEKADSIISTPKTSAVPSPATPNPDDPPPKKRPGRPSNAMIKEQREREEREREKAELAHHATPSPKKHLQLPPGVTEADLALFKKAQEKANSKMMVTPTSAPHPNVRSPALIQFGRHEIHTWYSSPYPQEYARYSTSNSCYLLGKDQYMALITIP